jgi:hypothetical protein
MKRVLYSTTIIFVFLISLGVTFYFILNGVFAETNLTSNNTMIVEVDLVGFTPPVPFVGIWIPDYVSLNNLSKKTLKTGDIYVDINNTGNVNVTVTPYLLDNSEDIFSYLYFKKRTSGYTYQKIGNWSMNIEKPDEEDEYRHDWFYMQLNLKEYDKEIKEDILGHRAEIIFYAMAQ